MPCRQRQRVMYILPCGHVRWLLPDSVRRRPECARRCMACLQGGSRLWQRAVHVLQRDVQGLGRLAFECQIVPGLQKRVDIYLVDWNIAVEVDGEQHFSGSYCGVPAEVQYARDRHVDAVCRQQGQRLVLLHYRDEMEWGSIVKEALASQEVVTYTTSYKL